MKTGASVEEDETKDSIMTPEASAEEVEGTTRPRIWGQRRRLQRHNDGSEELETTAEPLAQEDGGSRRYDAPE